jgi:predicted PolB exonuclease-like 3'-5' exonuclease
MDFFALYNGRNNSSLDQVSKLCGFPGKLDMDGGQVWKTYLEGNLKSIRDYCETDVVNTYLVYLRFLLIKTHISQKLYDEELQKTQKMLKDLNKPHWKFFIKAWQL